jgi:hypothetical protein
MLKRWHGQCSCRRFTMERLENTNVKDIMYPCVLWELQLVGDNANPLYNLEWSRIPWTELGLGGWQ